jgi:hypothetical protein
VQQKLLQLKMIKTTHKAMLHNRDELLDTMRSNMTPIKNSLGQLRTVFICLSILFSSQLSKAESEYSLGLGYYSLNAETSQGATTIANLGHVKFVYAMEINPKFIFWPGYSLYFLGGDGADLGFGIDLEVAYYPFSGASRYSNKSAYGKWLSYETIRPFFSLSFNQRSYQSVQSSYAGVGLSAGADFQTTENIFYFGKLSYLSLAGPLESSIGEFQVMAGVGGFIGE